MITGWRSTAWRSATWWSATWRSTIWRSAWRLALAAFSLIAPAIAFAADLPAQPSASSTAPVGYVSAAPDWIVTIGGEARVLPKWAGAPEDKFGLTGGPLVSIRKVGTPPEYFGPR